MKFLFYTHSLVSDWNHGNAHFLRGVMRELVRRGHQAVALEPADAWSYRNLVSQQGPAAVRAFHRAFPDLVVLRYAGSFDHETALEGADVVVVHEWTEPALVARIGRARRGGGRFTLVFHDTHHRAVSAAAQLSDLELADYDIILAFGETLRERYLRAGWGRNVVTWHEAADTTVFRPLANVQKSGDVIWIGNWGDDERSDEIRSFFINPVERLDLSATVHGVRYPEHALKSLLEARIDYRGWIANAAVPHAFAQNRLTVHIPRRPYVEALPGIPTIRMFEALACGIPLLSAPWSDVEGLFRAGQDFLFARDSDEMTRLLRQVLCDRSLAESLSSSGLETIRARHTCGHRVDELLAILARAGRTATMEAVQ